MKNLLMFFGKLKNLFRFREGPGEPIVFLRGSEEELRNVTKWVCFNCPSLFQYNGHVIIIYRATKNNTPGRCSVGFPRNTQTEFDYLNNACNLAFKFNEFTGTRWEFMGERRFRRPTELRGLLDIRITLPSEQKLPSNEEQEEARRLLSAWLEGKVSEEEKQTLFPMLSQAITEQ